MLGISLQADDGQSDKIAMFGGESRRFESSHGRSTSPRDTPLLVSSSFLKNDEHRYFTSKRCKKVKDLKIQDLATQSLGGICAGKSLKPDMR